MEIRRAGSIWSVLTAALTPGVTPPPPPPTPLSPSSPRALSPPARVSDCRPVRLNHSPLLRKHLPPLQGMQHRIRLHLMWFSLGSHKHTHTHTQKMQMHKNAGAHTKYRACCCRQANYRFCGSQNVWEKPWLILTSHHRLTIPLDLLVWRIVTLY